MRQVLFVQGGGEGVHDEWDNQLVDSLGRELGSEYEIRYPVMPNEAEPEYAAWKRALERELAVLEHGAIVVGHSIGGTILVNVLAERTPRSRLRAVCLIAAAFIGAGGWESEEIEPQLHLGARLPPEVPIFLYHGRNDETVPFAHVDLYARAIPRAHVRRLADRDHQLNNTLSELARDIQRLDDDSSAGRNEPTLLSGGPMSMRVEFYKGAEGRVCGWIATPPRRRPFQGSTTAAGRDLPHDLTQFTIERALDIRDGFWGLLAHGASFASVPGRKPTAPGRALARAHHAALVAVEGVVNGHYLAWQRGEPTPLRGTLDAMYARWLALAEGERLALEWPVQPLPGTEPRGRARRAARRGRSRG